MNRPQNISGRNLNGFYCFGSKNYHFPRSYVTLSRMYYGRAAYKDKPTECPQLSKALMEGTIEEKYLPLWFDAYDKFNIDLLTVCIQSHIHPPVYLISDAFKEVLEESGLTGWKTYPIKLIYQAESFVRIEGYHGFSITGRCESVTYSQCEIIERSYVPLGPPCKFYKGMGFNAWDGSDFFFPNKETGIIVTARAMKALTKANLSNLALRPLANRHTLVSDLYWEEFFKRNPQPTDRQIDAARLSQKDVLPNLTLVSNLYWEALSQRKPPPTDQQIDAALLSQRKSQPTEQQSHATPLSQKNTSQNVTTSICAAKQSRPNLGKPQKQRSAHTIKDFYFFKLKIDTSVHCSSDLKSLDLVENTPASSQLPLEFEASSLETLYDVMAWNASAGPTYLVSDRFIKVLETYRLTGWQSCPVELNHEGSLKTGYCALLVTGKCGPLTYDRAEVIERSYIPHGRPCKLYKGLCVPPDTWDGSDLFFVSEDVGVVVTYRAMRALAETNLTNIALKNLTEQETLASHVYWSEFLKNNPESTKVQRRNAELSKEDALPTLPLPARSSE